MDANQKPRKLVKINGELITVPTKFAALIESAPDLLALVRLIESIRERVSP